MKTTEAHYEMALKTDVGTLLLAAGPGSIARARMPAQDGRSAYGLLYLIAVWGLQPDVPWMCS